uniref:Uncharacterized protein n=1 Tax=Oryza brachyantha TaxID=4533 RepID=J3LXQ6_ORYBR
MASDIVFQLQSLIAAPLTVAKESHSQLETPQGIALWYMCVSVIISPHKSYLQDAPRPTLPNKGEPGGGGFYQEGRPQKHQSAACLCAVLLSDTVKHSGVKPEVAITIPKRCNLANRPVGYKCGRYTLPSLQD